MKNFLFSLNQSVRTNVIHWVLSNMVLTLVGGAIISMLPGWSGWIIGAFALASLAYATYLYGKIDPFFKEWDVVTLGVASSVVFAAIPAVGFAAIIAAAVLSGIYAGVTHMRYWRAVELASDTTSYDIYKM